MLTFGQIELHPKNELSSVYLERFELFILANSNPDSKEVPLFLTVLGGNTYRLWRQATQRTKASKQSQAHSRHILSRNLPLSHKHSIFIAETRLKENQ